MKSLRVGRADRLLLPGAAGCGAGGAFVLAIHRRGQAGAGRHQPA